MNIRNASVGRWHGVDPLAEAFIVHFPSSRDRLPYNYGVNNPIMMVDPDGRSATAVGGGKDDENLHGGTIMYDKDGNPTSVHFGNNSSSSNTSSNNYVHGVSGGSGENTVRYDGWMFNRWSSTHWSYGQGDFNKYKTINNQEFQINKKTITRKEVAKLTGINQKYITVTNGFATIYHPAYLQRLKNTIMFQKVYIKGENIQDFSDKTGHIKLQNSLYAIYILAAIDDVLDNGVKANLKSLSLVRNGFLIPGLDSDGDMDLFSTRHFAFEKLEFMIVREEGQLIQKALMPLYLQEMFSEQTRNPVFKEYLINEVGVDKKTMSDLKGYYEWFMGQ